MWLPRLCRSTVLSGGKQLVFAELTGGFLRPTLLGGAVDQIRGRKRALKKPLTKQERLERRLKREEKEAKRKQYTFMQRIANRRMAALMSPSEQFPGRYDPTADAELPEAPARSVFILEEYQARFRPIAEALDLHRRLQQPSIYNNANGLIRLRMELNMSTEKATKMISDSEEIVPVPSPFAHREKRTILAFTPTKESQELALEAGAETAVGPEMIKKILKGEFIITDYDFCVAHSSMASAILPLRGILRSKFPNINNGALGGDIPQMLQRFLTGVRLTIKCDPVYPHWGLATPIVGRLGMSNEAIEANIASLVVALCKHRSPALGPFVNRATLLVLPDRTCFAVDVSRYLPVATEEEIEKMESRQKKKKKKSKKAVDEETVEDKDAYLLSLM